jgi:hypothetical protein
MSESASKAVFQDGTEMFTVGDSTTVALDRLYDTRDEAWAAYVNGETPVDDAELMWVESEPVTMMTTYGSGEWVEMLTQNATASRGLLITRPHYPEREWFFGYNL